MDERLFTILDAARLGNTLEDARELNPDHLSLYSGRSAQLLADYAPYLFSFDPASSFSNWFFASGWGNSWGIFGCSTTTNQVLHHHFRRFLTVELEGSKPIYFRFYDPRVLRRFLPTCTLRQLTEFFGPVDYFWVEDEDPAYGLYFWIDEGELVTYRVSRDNMAQTFTQTSADHVRHQ